jgi:hypothetical protein
MQTWKRMTSLYIFLNASDASVIDFSSETSVICYSFKAYILLQKGSLYNHSMWTLFLHVYQLISENLQAKNNIGRLTTLSLQLSLLHQHWLRLRIPSLWQHSLHHFNAGFRGVMPVLSFACSFAMSICSETVQATFYSLYVVTYTVYPSIIPQIQDCRRIPKCSIFTRFRVMPTRL